MIDYDPMQSPDPGEWLELDEQERIDFVTEYHERAGEELPRSPLTPAQVHLSLRSRENT